MTNYRNGPPKEVGPVYDRATPTTAATTVDTGKTTAQPRQYVSSQQVSWWSVHEHVAPILMAVRSWPTAGTPQWCALDDGDPVKLAAIFDAAQHWALRLETCQQQRAEASHDVSGAADWKAIAIAMQRRREVYIPRAAS